MPQLEWLDLEWSAEVSDTSLDVLVETSSLRYVDMDFCAGFSESGLCRFRSRRPDIEMEGGRIA